jgi:alpha-L-fucosidase
MKVNGEAIHGSTPWKWFGEGSVNAQSGFFMDGDEKDFTAEDFRFTYKAGCIYAFQLRPDGKDVTIRTLAAKGMYDFCLDRVELLGYEGAVVSERTGEGLKIRLTEDIQTDLPLCFKIHLL